MKKKYLISIITLVIVAALAYIVYASTTEINPGHGAVEIGGTVFADDRVFPSTDDYAFPYRVSFGQDTQPNFPVDAYSQSDSAAVYGFGYDGVGVLGESETNHGMKGDTVAEGQAGVFGTCSGAACLGLYGQSGASTSNGRGVVGECNTGTSTCIGVLGEAATADTAGIGVKGTAGTGATIGVEGIGNTGMKATGSEYGVYTTAEAYGLSASATEVGGIGVYAVGEKYGVEAYGGAGECDINLGSTYILCFGGSGGCRLIKDADSTCDSGTQVAVDGGIALCWDC